jgi:hypothetical protein
MPSSRAISSSEGSRPKTWIIRRWVRWNLLTFSTMWTGMRIVRPLSAIARVMACRIHHVAYVENL